MEGPMKNLFDPAGKVALVTGGTSGLGHAIAEAFLQNGVDVAVCSRHPESAPELAELAAAEGRRYLPVYCDITKEEDVEKMGDIIEKELGPVTMLVNSAGMNILKHAEDYDAESFNKVMSLNVLGTHNVSKMCGKRWMIPAHKGRIVNLSSAKAFLGTDRDYTAYCASKGAINMYTAHSQKYRERGLSRAERKQAEDLAGQGDSLDPAGGDALRIDREALAELMRDDAAPQGGR